MKFVTNILTIIILFASFSLVGQNVEFTKQNFANDKKGLKQALGNIKNGDKLTAETPKNYETAIDFYRSAYEFNSKNALLNFKLGSCYYHIKDFKRAIDYFRQSKKLNPKVDFRLDYYLGVSYQHNYQFDSAIIVFQEFRRQLDSSSIKNNYRFCPKQQAYFLVYRRFKFSSRTSFISKYLSYSL